MKGNPSRQNSTGVLTLVTVLSMAALWGCKNNEQPELTTTQFECGPGTQLVEIDGRSVCQLVDGGACPPGQMQDPANPGACITMADPCQAVTCAPLPGAARTVAQVVNGSQCACVADGCQPGFSFDGGFCYADEECRPGFIQEGPNCVPDETSSCYDVPDSPLCVPTLCDEQPTSIDGRDLRALGKCIDAVKPPAESCINNCHNGIEDPHPWFGGPDLTCTGCHGGDPDATTRETAHVPIPSEWQINSTQWGRPSLRYYWNYNTLFGVENFPGGLEWLRFRNPGDLRIADQSCGKASGCHQDRVENVRRSVMATEVGLVGVAQQRNGIARTILRGEGGIYKFDSTVGMTLGQPTLESLAYDETNPSANPTGSVQRFTEFTIQNREVFGQYDQVDILLETYDKQCGDCHLGNNGQNNRYADFRSSGCASCHMPRALDGRSRSLDQMIKKDEPTYPAAYAQISNFDPNDLQNLNGAWLGPEQSHAVRHRLTRQMAAQRCGTCHVGSNRTDWQFRGYQIDPNRTAVTALNDGFLNANQVQFTDEIDNNQNAFARYHGQAQDQVLKFIDWDNNGLDDIPADIHFQAGLECMDCHTTGEMHNEIKLTKVPVVTDPSDPNQVQDMSGALWSHQDQATEVECVHCHGNLEYRALPYADGEGNPVEMRNPVRNLIVCPEQGETIPGYATPGECANLGRGRWMESKFTGQWHYVPQTFDTVNDVGAGTGGGPTRPGNLSPIYTLNASIFHGRFNDSLVDGIGPCANGDLNNCFRDQNNNAIPVTQDFSHLGRRAVNAVDQHQGGLECYACHATWANMCFGCHLRLIDTDGNVLLRDYARSTGELTLGFIAEADFTYISPLDMQYGINSEGKISQFLPETKQMLAHTDRNNLQYFGTQVIVNNDANIQYNVYRDRAGYGLRQYATELVGLQLNSDGRVVEQFAQMDNNAGQGAQQMMPHSVQRSHPLMDCNSCHIDLNQANADAIQARFMANPNGFANISAYLAVLANTGIVRNNSNELVVVDAAAGFRFDANIDPAGYSVDQQSDWCVLIADGFPLCYNSHPLKQNTYGVTQDPVFGRAWPQMAAVAGPLNINLLNKMFNEVIVNNVGVQFRGIR